MIAYCSEKLSDWLIRSGAVKKEDRELYEYAIYIVVLTCMPLMVFFLACLFLGTLPEGMLFLFTFMAIRKFSGGYHAKRAEICFFLSSMILIVTITVIDHIDYSITIAVLSTIAVMIIMVFSPVDSENRRLDQEEHRQYKKVSCLLTAAGWGISVLLFYAHQDTYAVCVSMGVILAALLLLPSVIIHISGRNNRKDNQNLTENVSSRNGN